MQSSPSIDVICSNANVAVDALAFCHLTGSIYFICFNDGGIYKFKNGHVSIVAGHPTEHGFAGDGGPAINARFNNPFALCCDSKGSLYIADIDNHRVRIITPDGIVRTFAGNGQYGSSGDGGPAMLAKLAYPMGIAVGDNNNLYIADYSNYRVRMVDRHGIITTVAGNGTPGHSGDGGLAVDAQMQHPRRLACYKDILYIAEDDGRICKVQDGIITTFAPITRYTTINEIAVDLQGNLFRNGREALLRHSLDGTITTWTIAHTIQGALAIDSSGDLLFGDNENNQICKIKLGNTLPQAISGRSAALPFLSASALLPHRLKHK